MKEVVCEMRSWASWERWRRPPCTRYSVQYFRNNSGEYRATDNDNIEYKTRRRTRRKATPTTTTTTHEFGTPDQVNVAYDADVIKKENHGFGLLVQYTF
jgi:hypothetical protein